MKKIRPRATIECPNCRTTTKNLGAHQRGKAHLANLDEVERDIIIRAGAHGASATTLAEEARFRGCTTDLDVARLLRHLEAGMEVVRGGSRWLVATKPHPFRDGHLGNHITEGLRLGLLAEADGRIVPAPVHARSATDLTVPACGANALRWRLLGGVDLPLVDCADCLDLPLSAVSYLSHDD